jgi:DNA-binding MarR family transcriptional regulator
MLLVFSRTGALPLSRIGTRLQVHATSVTSAVDRLERQGFVRRRPHPTDGRTTLAELTADGREVAAQATKALNDQVFANPGLANEQLQALFSVLRDLRRQAGDF